MALTGVLRPGHAQIRVTELAESVAFYTNVLGLIQTGSDESGRVFLKTWDERDKFSLVLRQAQAPGLDFFGFKVLDNSTLAKFESDLRSWGVQTRRMPSGELLDTGERVQFQAPSGHTFELYSQKRHVGTPMGLRNPSPWCPEAERGISPIRMDHTQLNGVKIAETAEMFVEVLGFKITETLMMSDGKSPLGIWLSCSNKAHDIAFVAHGEPNKLHHVSFLLESWEKVLRAADLMSMNGVKIDMGPTRHGITRGATIYAFDPSGNRFETFCGGAYNYPDWEPVVWDFDEVGAAVYYHDRRLNDSFLNVLT
jgi:catechol 2,3-dioxygenase